MLYAAIALPKVFGAFVPQSGDGPDRKVMEDGSLTLHGVAKMVSATTTSSGSSEKDEVVEKKVKAKFRFKQGRILLIYCIPVGRNGDALGRKIVIFEHRATNQKWNFDSSYGTWKRSYTAHFEGNGYKL